MKCTLFWRQYLGKVLWSCDLQNFKFFVVKAKKIRSIFFTKFCFTFKQLWYACYMWSCQGANGWRLVDWFGWWETASTFFSGRYIKIYVTFQTLTNFFFRKKIKVKNICTCFPFPSPPLWTLFPLPSSHQSLCRIWQLKQMKLTKKTRLQSQSSNSTQPKISSVVTE